VQLSAPTKTAAEAGEKKRWLPKRVRVEGARSAPQMSRTAVNASGEVLGQRDAKNAERLCTKSLDRALLCATSVSSVSLWLMNSE